VVAFRFACDKPLRYAVDQLAWLSLQRSEWARAYYDQQRARGHRHRRALRALGAQWPKAIVNLPQLRPRLSSIVDAYLDVQQDILETFVDRGQLRALSQPTLLPNGKRTPGLKLDHPRQLALMHALVSFSHIAAGSTFTTAELHAHTAAALGGSQDDNRLSSLRYELSKLRAKGLIEKLPHSRQYRLLPEGYCLCLVFLKLFERIYAPLTAGLLHPVSADRHLLPDRLYQRVIDALDHLVRAVGLKAA